MADKPIITVDDIDLSKRKPPEWASIYCIKLNECDNITELMNEYEFAWNLMHKYKYSLLPDKQGEYDYASMKELRAEMLAMDIYINATSSEKYVLDKEKKYLDTEFIRTQLHLI